MPIFYDTNILIYSVGLNPEESDKTVIAKALLDREDWNVSVQVLQEFFVQATRPSRAARLSSGMAAEFIATWRRQPVQEMTLAILDEAIAIHRRYSLSYWDSAIVAAAKAQRCDRLYSEDLADGQEVAGVRISDPFREIA
ncbi:MAG: PIN domain-containing protein [Sphingomonadaceae bacterium]